MSSRPCSSTRGRRPLPSRGGGVKLVSRAASGRGGRCAGGTGGRVGGGAPGAGGSGSGSGWGWGWGSSSGPAAPVTRRRCSSAAAPRARAAPWPRPGCSSASAPPTPASARWPASPSSSSGRWSTDSRGLRLWGVSQVSRVGGRGAGGGGVGWNCQRPSARSGWGGAVPGAGALFTPKRPVAAQARVSGHCRGLWDLMPSERGAT